MVMYKVIKNIYYYYNNKECVFSAGDIISQQALESREFTISQITYWETKGYLEKLQEPVVEIQAQVKSNQAQADPVIDNQDPVETKYRFEQAGYKQKDGTAFRKGTAYTETAIKDAGLDAMALVDEEVLTLLK